MATVTLKSGDRIRLVFPESPGRKDPNMPPYWADGWEGEIKEFFFGGNQPSTDPFYKDSELAIVLLDKSPLYGKITAPPYRQRLPQFLLRNIELVTNARINYNYNIATYAPLLGRTGNHFLEPKKTLPKTHGCDCGAYVTYGAGKGSTLHSDWCGWK